MLSSVYATKSVLYRRSLCDKNTKTASECQINNAFFAMFLQGKRQKLICNWQLFVSYCKTYNALHHHPTSNTYHPSIPPIKYKSYLFILLSR